MTPASSAFTASLDGVHPTPHPAPDQLVALPTWAAQQGLPPVQVRRLRSKGRLAPVYRIQTQRQTYYFLTLESRVLPPTQRAEDLQLEGYVALHDLEAAVGSLRMLADRLTASGRIAPVGHHPLLLTRADAEVLLEAHRERGGGPSAPLAPSDPPSSPTPRTAAPSDPGISGEAVSTLPEGPNPPPVPPGSGALGPDPVGTGVPFVPQLGWVTIPRFEGRREHSGMLVLDRGVAAEHLHAPRPLAQIFDADLATQLFPVLDLRPPSVSSASEAQPPTAVPSVPLPPVPTAEEDTAVTPDPEAEALRAQLEAAQERLRTVEAALERQRTEGAAGAAWTRMPDRRVRQLEAALAERDTLRETVNTLETEQQRLLADQARLRERASRVSHLAHVRKRLLERFGLTFSEAQVDALDRQARALEAVGFTQQDKPFKKLRLGEHTIYALMGRDEHGEECMATVYDEAMFQKAQQRRSRRK